MVQHARHAGEVRHDTNSNLFFCIKECHSQKESRHHGVLLQEACEHSNQATPNVIASAPTAEETISDPSEYEVMRTNAIVKKNRATQTRLEKVLSYTKQTMIAYMSEEELNRLCTYIVAYSYSDTLQKISPVNVESQLNKIHINLFR